MTFKEEMQSSSQERRFRDKKIADTKAWLGSITGHIDDIYIGTFASRLIGSHVLGRREKLVADIAEWFVDQINLHSEEKLRQNVIACARNVLNDKIADFRKNITVCEAEVSKLNCLLVSD